MGVRISRPPPLNQALAAQGRLARECLEPEIVPQLCSPNFRTAESIAVVLIPVREYGAVRVRALGLVALLIVALLAVPVAAEAQATAKVPVIGLLDATSLSARAELVGWFRQGLREFGYVEGRNILIEYRWAEGRFDRLPGLAADLVRTRVDVIAALAIPAAIDAKSATTAIPIVMVGVTQPVESGLVTSLAQPGGNITGLSSRVDCYNVRRALALPSV